MRKLIILLFASSLFTTLSTAQTPKYFLNFVEIEMEKTYINPMSIDSMNVTKETQFGEIHIFTKDEHEGFTTLEDLLLERFDLKKLNESTLIRINDKYISDIDGIQIDKSYHIYTKKRSLSEAKYLSNEYRRLVVIDIDLETKNRKKEILLRGQKSSLYTFIKNIIFLEYGIDPTKEFQKMPEIVLNDVIISFEDLNSYEYNSLMEFKYFKPEDPLTTALYGTSGSKGVILIKKF